MAQAPTTVLQEINGLYIALYGRAADGPGIDYWIGQLSAFDPSITLANAASTAISVKDATFLGNLFVSTQASYFNSQYGTLSDEQFVQQLYINIGGNSGDPNGVAYWLNLLTAAEAAPGATPQSARAGIVGQFVLDLLGINLTVGAAALGLTPAEYAAAVERQEQFQNKVAVSQYYANESLLPGGNILVAASTSSAAFTAAMDALAAVTFDSNTVTTAEQAIAQAVSGGSLNPILALPTTPTGQTFVLVSTGNNITAPATNNNIINGTFNGAAATFVPVTTINLGTTTGNTLNLVDLSSGGVGNPTNIFGVNVSDVQTVNISSGEAVTANTASSTENFTGITQLSVNSFDNGANADAISAGATTNISVTDAAIAGASGTLTINGGLAVTLTETDSDGGAAVLLSPISIGGTTAPAGAVTVTVTGTLTAAGSAPANITIGSATGGAAAVTVSSTVNDGIALAASTGTEAANKASTISITGTTGAVVVNDALNITSLTTIATNADQVVVTSGLTITVNETVSTSQAATSVSSITEGAVSITGGANTTSVTVNQAAVATGQLVSAAVAAVTEVLAVAGETAQPGITGVTAVAGVAASPGVAAVTAGTPTVTADGVVIISDKNHAMTTTASNSITSVTLSGFSAGAAIFGNALTNLSLSGTGGVVDIINAATGAGLTNTTLNLAVSGLTPSTLSDVNNEITTLDITTGGSPSTLTSILDTSLLTLNVSGTGVFVLTSVPTTITTLTVTGSAGFSGNITGTGVTAFAPTSSGVVTVTLNDTTQTFTGSTGQDIVTIAADATKAITGGSATNNELILNGDSSTFSSGKTGANVTGFTTLGVTGNTAATLEVYNMSAVFKGFNAIEVISGSSGAGSDAFTNVATGSSLALDSSLSGTGGVAAVEGTVAGMSLLYQVNNINGPTDSVNVSIGTAQTNALVDNGLMFEDADANGVGTLNILSNGTFSTVGNTITTLVDNGLSNLNVSGSEGLNIGTLDEATTQAVSFAIDNTSSGVVLLGAFTDANLGSLTVSGNGLTGIASLNDSGHVLSIANNGSGYLFLMGALTDSSLTNLTFNGSSGTDLKALSAITGTSLTLANTGTGAATVGDGSTTSFLNSDATLKTLTLTGNVGVGVDSVTGSTPNAENAIGATTGVTVSGASDNAHVNINLTGAAVGDTDNINLGNGNDYITDGSTAGTVNVTVGTGSNLIDLHTGSAATYAATVTIGVHTAPDVIDVGVVAASANAPNTTITGVVAGDMISIADATSFVALTGTQQANVSAEASLAAAISYVDSASVGLAAHTATLFTYASNTYLLETVAGGAGDSGTMAAGNTLVELVGIHTESGFASHIITLGS